MTDETLNNIFRKASKASLRGRDALAAELLADASTLTLSSNALISVYCEARGVNYLGAHLGRAVDTFEENAAIWRTQSARVFDFFSRPLPHGDTNAEKTFYRNYLILLYGPEKWEGRGLYLGSVRPFFGHVTHVSAGTIALYGINHNLLDTDKLSFARALVLKTMDNILTVTDSLPYLLMEEKEFFLGIQNIVRKGVVPFCEAVRERWHAPEMLAMLMKKDSSHEDMSNLEDYVFKRNSKSHNEDVKLCGLRLCSSPSCGKREGTVAQFKVCSACRAVWYCSVACSRKHWGKHSNLCTN